MLSILGYANFPIMFVSFLDLALVITFDMLFNLIQLFTFVWSVYVVYVFFKVLFDASHFLLLVVPVMLYFVFLLFVMLNFKS